MIYTQEQAERHALDYTGSVSEAVYAAIQVTATPPEEICALLDLRAVALHYALEQSAEWPTEEPRVTSLRPKWEGYV
jgi:hypothetical protein